ncbi:MAG TPA: hypothetical protein VI322_00690 [Candidatus Saccharimonadia bacterium]
MHDDKAWDRIVDAIEAKFGIDEHGRTKRPVEDSHDLTESVAFVVFTRGGQRYKIERVQGPVIIDRKTIGARRAGASVHYRNVYDPAETTFRTLLFVEGDDGAWEEINADAFDLADSTF